MLAKYLCFSNLIRILFDLHNKPVWPVRGKDQLQMKKPRPGPSELQWFSADTLCLFQYPLSLTFLYACVSLVTVLRAARVISCLCENSLLYSVQTIGFACHCQVNLFILQTHIECAVNSHCGLGSGSFVNKEHSGISHKHSCHMC